MKGLFLAFALIASAALCAETRVSRVDITSQPDRATVIVDGVDRGLTPVTLFDLAPGRHSLKYRLAGFVERDRHFKSKGYRRNSSMFAGETNPVFTSG